ncbi:MAG: hypothetical protein K2H44_02530 [Muribaculaceae bacterium]|nr:hypothetical protein [Muribaculaceae bacterium]
MFITLLSACSEPGEDVIPETPKFIFPDGWQSITNHEEKIAFLQIPENILPKMSTEDLVEVCMTYPLGPECFFYNDYQFGLARGIDNFNGFAELKKRVGAFEKILDYYEKELDSMEELTDSKELSSRSFQLSYDEQFIISGYLLSVDQLKDSKKLISLYYKARKLRENKDLGGQASINTLNAMKKVLGLE